MRKKIKEQLAVSKKFFLSFVFFLFFSGIIFAQSGAYLIPRQIFVGDPAVLVLPLPAAVQNYADVIIVSQSDNIPLDENIDLSRILLERRVTGSRLLIEFTAFSPGLIELPVIEIGGESFSGLSVNVNSVIESGSPLVLSGAASGLVMPGTALMLYGSLAVCIIVILLTVWFFVKGRSFFHKLQKKWKHYRLFKSIHKTEKQLYRAVLKGENKRVILDKLSDGFRLFLSAFTGTNCRALTASEFVGITLMPDNNKSFLCDFFRNCDGLRFSGNETDSQDVLLLLDDFKQFIIMLENDKNIMEGKTA